MHRLISRFPINEVLHVDEHIIGNLLAGVLAYMANLDDGCNVV